jgi:hypothetical protein
VLNGSPSTGSFEYPGGRRASSIFTACDAGRHTADPPIPGGDESTHRCASIRLRKAKAPDQRLASEPPARFHGGDISSRRDGEPGPQVAVSRLSPDDFHFRIDLWDDEDRLIEQVIAFVSDLEVARAAYAAAG